MTATGERMVPTTSISKQAAVAKPSWGEALGVYLRPRVLIVLFLGFSAGLPLALSGSGTAIATNPIENAIALSPTLSSTKSVIS